MRTVMPNIKETILRATDRHGLDVSLQAAEIIAEALVAELAKENKPVGHVDYGDRVEWYGTKPLPETDLYTLPPTAEQIEQETAEACAKVYLNTYDLTDIADDIRNGAWKEFK